MPLRHRSFSWETGNNAGSCFVWGYRLYDRHPFHGARSSDSEGDDSEKVVVPCPCSWKWDSWDVVGAGVVCDRGHAIPQRF